MFDMSREQDLYFGYKRLQEIAYRNSERSYSFKDGKYVPNLTLSKTLVDVVIDIQWLDMFEECLPYVENCVYEFRSFLKNEDEIMLIQLSNKIDVSKTLTYMTQHVDSIIEYDEIDENITPGKLVNTVYENTYDIYENRFLFTLLMRCNDFMGDLYQDVERIAKKNFFHISFDYNREDKICETSNDMSLSLIFDKSEKQKSDKKVQLDKISRLTAIQEKINELMGSELIRALKKCKEVSDPLTMTNVLQKNPNFVKAVALWNFMTLYEGKKVEIIEKDRLIPVTPAAKDNFYEMSSIVHMLSRTYIDPDFTRRMDREYKKFEAEEAKKRSRELAEKIKAIKEEITRTLNEKHQKEIAALNEQIYLLKQKIEHYKTAMHKDKSELVEHFMQELDLLYLQRRELEQKLIDKYSGDLQEAKDYLQKLRDQYLEEADRRVEEEKARMDQQMKLQKEEFRRTLREFEKKKRDEIEKLNFTHEAQIQELEARYTEQINKIIEDKNKEIEKLKEAYEQKIKEIKEDYEQQIALLKQQHAEEIAELKRQHAEEIAELKHQHAEEIAELKRQHAEEIAELKRKHAEEIAELNRRHAEEIAELKRQHAAEIEALKEQHAQAMLALQLQHQNEVQKLNDEHANEMQALSQAHENEVERLNQEHATVVDDLKSTHAAQVTRMSRDHATQISQLNAKHEQTCNNLTNKYERELQRLNVDHTAKINSLNKAHTDALSKMRSAAEEQRKAAEERLEKTKSRHTDELSKLKVTSEKQLDAVKKEHAQVMRDMTSKSDSMKKTYEEQLRARESQSEALKAEHEKQLRETTAASQEMLRVVQAKYDKSITDSMKLTQGLKNDLNANLKKHKKELDACNKRHKKELNATVRSLNEKHAAELETAVNRAKREYKDTKKAERKRKEKAVQMQDSILASLRKRLENYEALDDAVRAQLESDMEGIIRAQIK